MIIRIESSITIQVAQMHFLKEARSLEMEHDDILVLLATDPDLKERYEQIATNDKLDYEAVQDAFDSGFAALKDCLWGAIDNQLKELEELG